MMAKHIVTGIRPFDFVTREGERLQGVKVFYLSDHEENEPEARGYFPLNLSLNGESHERKFVEVPAIYDLKFKNMPDKYGRPQQTLYDVEFVESIELPTV